MTWTWTTLIFNFVRISSPTRATFHSYLSLLVSLR
jgi:hypothetical protein